jgi:hypothetical protein
MDKMTRANGNGEYLKKKKNLIITLKTNANANDSSCTSFGFLEKNKL